MAAEGYQRKKAGASSAPTRNSNGVFGHVKGAVAAAQVLTARPPPAGVPPGGPVAEAADAGLTWVRLP